MNGRDDTTTFLPLDSRIGGQNKESLKVGQYLTRDQTRYIYKKVETGEMINMDTIQQEIEQEKQLSRIDDMNGEINPYRELIVKNAERTEPLMTQMEQWSILYNILNYVQHSKFNSMNHTLDVKAVIRHKIKSDTDREFKELDFGTTPQKLQEEYMDIYEGIHSDIVSSNRCDENSDTSTTYLGKIENRGNQDKSKAEESFVYRKVATLWVDCKMEQNANCYFTWVPVNPSCQSHFICNVNHYIPYQNLPQPHKGYKSGTVSVLVYYL